LIGKHHIFVDQMHDVALIGDTWHKAPAPRVNETMVLDTRQRREMFEQAVAAGERSQLSPDRLRVPTLAVLSGARTKKSTGWSGTDRDRAFEDGNRPAPRLVHAEYCGADQQARGCYYLGRGTLCRG